LLHHYHFAERCLVVTVGNPQHRIVWCVTEIIAVQVSEKHTGNRLDAMLLCISKHWTKRSTTAAMRLDVPGIEALYRGFGLGTTSDTQDQWIELAEELRLWRARISDARQRRTEFVNGVKMVLNNHSTLAPALREWAPLWDLLPEHYRDRHKEVKERVVSEKTAVSSDVLGKLTGAITAAKLGGM